MSELSRIRNIEERLDRMEEKVDIIDCRVDRCIERIESFGDKYD